jgi:hypothetical protein
MYFLGILLKNGDKCKLKKNSYVQNCWFLGIMMNKFVVFSNFLKHPLDLKHFDNINVL